MTTKRGFLLGCASVLGGVALGALSFGTPALAQGTNGAAMGGTNPFSTHASNLPTSPNPSKVAPQLPSTGLGPNATIGQNLQVAQSALTSGKTGLAQQALENAATLALTRPVPYGTGNQPDTSPLVKNISQALNALGQHDIAGAQHYTTLAMQEAGT